MRPNFFANTPDILHAYLQEGGRAAFQVRAVLAATLAATYGIYSGFELCENRAVPGTEEYLDSEKYQIRQWDWDRPGHIRPLLTRLNLIRRACPALQHDWTLGFHETDNDQLICYSKTAGASAVLVVVNLDPHHLQHGWIRVPLERLGLAAGAAFEVVDRLTGERYGWTGDSAYVRLDPAERVAHVLEVA
jgi:starch synthase (maltosyl-transferring)